MSPRRWQYVTCVAALAIGLSTTPIPTPAPIPTPEFECQIVPVPSAAPCYCCRWVTWRRWHPDRPDERVEAPLNCSCPGVR